MNKQTQIALIGALLLDMSGDSYVWNGDMYVNEGDVSDTLTFEQASAAIAGTLIDSARASRSR